MKLIATLSSDLILKSPPVRKKFQRILLNNIRRSFKEAGVVYKMNIDLGHIFLEADQDFAKEIILRTFGVDSIALIEGSCTSTLDEICKAGVALYKDYVFEACYAVFAKRKGQHDFTSEQVNKELGARLKTEKNWVNLKRPDKPVYLYIKNEITYFYSEKIKAQGGLPLGSGGKALCLISGGFDSVLASWLIQKRGVLVDYLFCNLGGKAYERSTLGVAKNLVDLWGHGSQPKFFTLDFTELVKEVQEKVKPSFNQVVLKRLFYKAAERLCFTKKYDAIITGEAIGQVSSQTLKNLRALDENLSFPVLRPLVAFNKNEIISKCQDIGCYELASKVQEFCQITKEKPVTGTNHDFLMKEYSKLNLDKILEIFKAEKKVSLKDQNFNIDDEGFFLIDHIPEGSIILDCRQENSKKKKSFAGVLEMNPHDFENLKPFSKEKKYLLFCEHSNLSLLFAEKMQKEGYTAYGLEGGERTLEKIQSEEKIHINL